MAKYKLLETAFIHQRLWQPGEVVEVSNDLIPGPHMKPLDKAAQAAVKRNGVIVGPSPNYVDEVSGGASVQSRGASPQDIKSGIEASDVEALGMLRR
jgi:hypothetical protein